MEFTPAILEDPRQLVVSALPQSRATSSLLQGLTSTVPTLRTVLPRRDWSLWTEVEVGDPPDEARLKICDHLVHVFPAPNGKWFAVYTRGQAGDVYLCDAKTARALRTLHCHVDQILDLDISPNSRLLVTTSSGGEVHITDLRSGSWLHRLSDESDVCFVCFVTAFSGDQAVLLAESTGHFRLWKFSSNQSEVQMLTDRADTRWRPCDSLSPRVRTRDASQVTIRWHEGSIVWVDVHRDVVKTLHLQLEGSQVCLLGPYRALVTLPGSFGSSVVETYSLFNGELVLLHSENTPEPFSLEGVVASLDGDLAVIYYSFGEYCIWNSATSISQAQPLAHIDWHNSLFISLDGRYIYALAARRNSCRIVDLHNPRLHAHNMASGDRKWSVCVSADSSTVAIAELADNQVVAVTAYCVSDGFETFRLTPHGCVDSFESFTLGAYGKLLLLCYGTEIQLWDRNSCIGTFGDLPKLLYLEAATMSEDATYVIGVGHPDDGECAKSIVIWSMEGSTPPVVIDVNGPAVWCSNIYAVHIDETLDIYLVSDDSAGEWFNAAFVLEHRIWSAVPKKVVQLRRTPRIPNERFTLHRDGWVTRFDDGGSGTLERVCWIPPSRRTSKSVRFHGHTLPLLSDSGEVSFFDLCAFIENTM